MRVFQRAGLLALGLLVGCGGDDAGCTPNICVNGLAIILSTPPAGPYRVEAIGPGETTPHAQDCAGTSPCHIVFPNYQPATVTVSVISATGTTTYDKKPLYMILFPPPGGCFGCRDGEVTVP